MKSLLLYLFPALLLFISACTEQVEIAQDDCTKFVKLSYFTYDSLRTDAINVMSAKVDGDCLKLSLQYGGGCKDHQVDLALILPECGTPPLPPPTFEIRHNANNDACKALITKNYSFNISGIREEGKNQVEFVLNARNSSGIAGSNTYTYKY
jgi:hypothetical protein